MVINFFKGLKLLKLLCRNVILQIFFSKLKEQINCQNSTKKHCIPVFLSIKTFLTIYFLK